mgnify:CR=1 FL=1
MEAKECESREYLLTVGNIEKSVATLVDIDYNIMELPRYLLPTGIGPVNLVRITISHDKLEEEKRQ